MRVHIDTYGCRTNLADSSLLARELVQHGMVLSTSVEDADAVVVNSCTVTHGADRDAGKALRRARKANPGALLVLAGCIPAAYPEHGVLRFADVVVVGNRSGDVVGALVAHVPARGQRNGIGNGIGNAGGGQRQRQRQRQGLGQGQEGQGQGEGQGKEFALEEVHNLSRANIKIGEGCDEGCAYCVVPRARGRPVSRPLDVVLGDVAAAVAAGFTEVVLTATHVAKYGKDLSPPQSLVGLMTALEESQHPCRVRLSSMEPDEQLFPVLERMGESRRWCRHAHIALQHCSDAVLLAMGRKYGWNDAERLVRAAASAVPGIGIGLDVITGFPGETEGEFELGYERLRQLPFAYLHVFSFSPRPGTVAARETGPDPRVVKERSERLRRLSAQRKESFAAGFVGKRMEVMVERRRERTGERLIGLTDNYLRVYMEGPDRLMGRLVECEVTGTEGPALTVAPFREIDFVA